MSNPSASRVLDPSHGRPHFVLLGAGASRQAFPNGDANGKRLPVMSDFVEVVGLGPVLKAHGLDYPGENFEALFSRLAADPSQGQLVAEIESVVSRYFRSLVLPDTPTLYDHLVLSLRDKDFIATFNWDPFLEQAIRRNYVNRRLHHYPRFAHLHGCASMAFCDKHQPITICPTDRLCLTCGAPTTPMRLLYPVAEKDYEKDPHIKAAWNDCRTMLKGAYLVTVFGYSAPATDSSAVRLLSEAWGNPQLRSFEEIEIIDIREEDDLRRTWRKFIRSHHYRTCSDFFRSTIGCHPRRTCESVWSETMDCEVTDETPAPRTDSLDDLWEWHRRLFLDEVRYSNANDSGRNG